MASRRIFYDFVAVSRGILRAGPRNLAKWAPVIDSDLRSQVCKRLCWLLLLYSWVLWLRGGWSQV